MTKPEAPTTPAVGSQLVRGVSPLPEPNSIHIDTGFRSYSADQMHAYAAASVAAERERARVLVLAAVHHAVNACASATGQHRVIGHFVNKLHIANEVMVAVGYEA